MDRHSHPIDRLASTAAWPCLQATADGCRLALSVVPHAQRSQTDGLHDGALRLRLAALPVAGQANAKLCEWLAAQLKLPQRAVRVRRGPASRRKQVDIDSEVAAVAAWLSSAVAVECR